MPEYVKVLFYDESHFGNKTFKYKINEVNIADNWNPNSNDDIGGFCYASVDNIARYLIRGDTLYDVIIPDDAEVVKIERDCGFIFRTNKIILTNPTPITENLALDLLEKSNMPEKAYFKTLAGYAVKGYINAARQILKLKINSDNINEALTEYQNFYVGDSVNVGCFNEILEDLKLLKNNYDTINELFADNFNDVNDFENDFKDSSIIANRYEIKNETYNGDLASTYDAIDLQITTPVRLIEITDDNTANKLIDKSKIFNKIGRFNKNLATIQRIFKYKNKIYFVESHNPSAIRLDDYIFENKKKLDWVDVCQIFLPIIRTLISLRSLNFHGKVSCENLYINENKELLIEDMLIQEAESSMNVDFEINDVYNISSLMYLCLTGHLFEDESDPFVVVNTMNELKCLPKKDHKLILEGLNIYPRTSFEDLNSFYNLMLSASKDVYYLSFFKIPDSIILCQNKLLKTERNFRKLKKKRRKREIKKFRRKWRLISTVVTTTILLLICASAKVIAPSIININALVSNTDITSKQIAPVVIDNDISSEQEIINIPEKSYSVPDLIGKSLDSVQDSVKYENFDIRVIDEIYSEEYEVGDIISQTIEKKTMVAKHTPIGIVLSLGSNNQKIPDIKNKSVSEAFNILSDSGFTLGEQKEEYNSTIPAGYVISTLNNIEKAQYGSMIGIVVSLGPAPTITSSTTTTADSDITTETTTTKTIVKSEITSVESNVD